MDDGLFVASEGSDVGIDMKRVRVAAQAIDESLVDVCLVVDDNIRLSVGTRRDGCALSRAFESTSSQGPRKDAAVNVVSWRFSSLLVDQIASDPVDQHCAFLSLVDDIDQLRAHPVGSSRLQSLVDHEKLLLAVEDAMELEVRQVGIAGHVDHRL